MSTRSAGEGARGPRGRVRAGCNGVGHWASYLGVLCILKGVGHCVSYRYLGDFVINPGREWKGQSVKRGQAWLSGPLMTEQGKDKGESGTLGLWEAGGGKGKVRNRAGRGQGRVFI